jgi:hypothetical protein
MAFPLHCGKRQGLTGGSNNYGAIDIVTVTRFVTFIFWASHPPLSAIRSIGFARNRNLPGGNCTEAR